MSSGVSQLTFPGVVLIFGRKVWLLSEAESILQSWGGLVL